MDSTRWRKLWHQLAIKPNKTFSGNLQIVFPVAVVLLSVPPDHLSAAVPLPVDEVPDESFPLLLRKSCAVKKIPPAVAERSLPVSDIVLPGD